MEPSVQKQPKTEEFVEVVPEDEQKASLALKQDGLWPAAQRMPAMPAPGTNARKRQSKHAAGTSSPPFPAV
jgi:hypothetical protein